MKTRRTLSKKVPALRGKIHIPLFGLFAYFVYLAFKHSCDPPFKMASIIHLLCSLFNFSASTVLHNLYWSSVERSIMRRIDYAGIFLMIGGTGFPYSIHYMNSDVMVCLVMMHWLLIFFGVFGSLLFNFTSTPKSFRSVVYVLSAMPYVYHIYMGIVTKFYFAVVFILSTLFFYFLGAVCYTREKPNLIPGVFEYHELFHLLCCFGFLSSSVVNYIYWKLNVL